MATTLRGFLDGFRGLLGNAVGSRWRTIDVIKGRPSKSNKPKTAAQLEQQMRFGLATEMVSDLSEYIKIGYQSFTNTTTTPTNAAVQQILKEAITGTYPALKIDYSKVILSKGKVVVLDQPNAILVDDEINVTWLSNNYNMGHKLDTDLVIAIFYDSTTHRYLVVDGIQRSALKLLAPLPYMMKGHPIHGYLFLVSKDGKLVSNTDYLGQFTVPL